MAASNTFIKRIQHANGIIEEQGTWTSSGGTTTHTITADTTDDTNPQIARVGWVRVTSLGGTAVVDTYATTLTPSQVKLTFTANDSGTYSLFSMKGA